MTEYIKPEDAPEEDAPEEPVVEPETTEEDKKENSEAQLSLEYDFTKLPIFGEFWYYLIAPHFGDS